MWGTMEAIREETDPEKADPEKTDLEKIDPEETGPEKIRPEAAARPALQEAVETMPETLSLM